MFSTFRSIITSIQQAYECVGNYLLSSSNGPKTCDYESQNGGSNPPESTTLEEQIAHELDRDFKSQTSQAIKEIWLKKISEQLKEPSCWVEAHKEWTWPKEFVLWTDLWWDNWEKKDEGEEDKINRIMREMGYKT